MSSQQADSLLRSTGRQVGAPTPFSNIAPMTEGIIEGTPKVVFQQHPRIPLQRFCPESGEPLAKFIARVIFLAPRGSAWSRVSRPLKKSLALKISM